MENVLIAVHLVIVLALAGVVLIQRSEGGGLGTSASPSSFMSGRGQANLLTRITAILGAAFFVTSLSLGVLASRSAPKQTPIGVDVPAPGAPATPSGTPNVLDQLRNLQGGSAPKQ
ncbi:SecG Preprotein translocase subunit SecG [Rhabdaerophilaceae bacterium]